MRSGGTLPKKESDARAASPIELVSRGETMRYVKVFNALASLEAEINAWVIAEGVIIDAVVLPQNANAALVVYHKRDE